MTTVTLIVKPKNEKELTELVTLMKSRKIEFSKKEEEESKSPYNAAFVKEILSQPKRGREIDPHNIWESIK